MATCVYVYIIDCFFESCDVVLHCMRRNSSAEKELQPNKFDDHDGH